jgi:CHAT domain-containing protein
VVTAVLVVNGDVFQRITITLQAGSLAPGTTRAVTAKSSGVTMASTLAAPAREHDQQVNLIIIKEPAGYKFIAQNGGVKRASINLSEAQIDEMIGQARTALRELVYKLVNGEYVYQKADTTIAPEVHAEALKVLARVGVGLYNKLFYSPGTSGDANAMGDLLRQVSQEQKSLHIKIVAERFIFPWTLLYDREYFGDDNETVEPEGFWGFKHTVEYAPEFTSATPINFNPQIKAEGPLQFAFLANTTIDGQLGIPVIQEQQQFVKTLQGINLTQYTTRQELYSLLRNKDTPIQLLYIYCHAVSNLPGEKGGVSGSKLLLSDGAATLSDLELRAPARGPIIQAAPLIFLNACQGAELSPYLYDGLVPYLISRGARGVIGTEVDTPALFAAEFAREFLTRFIAGDETLGELLLDLRRKYLQEKNNIMGLVYALYSSGDVVVQRAS